jgi:hypothetical protein
MPELDLVQFDDLAGTALSASVLVNHWVSPPVQAKKSTRIPAKSPAGPLRTSALVPG